MHTILHSENITSINYGNEKLSRVVLNDTRD